MKKSFTLIELLVVIAIIGLLVIIIAIPINRVRRGASIARTLQYEASLHRYLGADIVGWWQFNEGEGSVAYDISGYSNDGTIHGATYVDGVPGKEGYALEFDGSNDYVEVAQGHGLLSKNITISMWINPPIWDGVTALITSRESIGTHGLMFFRNTSPNTLHFDWGGRWNANYLPPTNQWTHLVITRDSNARILYVNGVLNSSTSAGSNPNQDAILRIGVDTISNQYNFNGKIDDLRIYSRALTSEEIQTIYTETKDKYITEEL